jgi:hypothetical protein
LVGKGKNPFFKKDDVFVDITLKKLNRNDDPFTSRSRKDVESFEFNLSSKKVGQRGKGIP